MIKEFLHPMDFSLGEGKEKRQALRVMDHPELSLGRPSLSSFTESSNSSSEYDDGSHCRKRKLTWDELTTQSSIELQLNDPLPLEWEQCLDLQSGRMYYMNRKSLKKSWVRPKDEKLDLELNISYTLPTSSELINTTTDQVHDHPKNNHIIINPTTSGNMVAVACANCHLLVMLCRSSPSCPNCKFVHSLTPKPLETLSLLH